MVAAIKFLRLEHDSTLPGMAAFVAIFLGGIIGGTHLIARWWPASGRHLVKVRRPWGLR
jgi:hypothetical protein